MLRMGVVLALVLCTVLLQAVLFSALYLAWAQRVVDVALVIDIFLQRESVWLIGISAAGGMLLATLLSRVLPVHFVTGFTGGTVSSLLATLYLARSAMPGRPLPETVLRLYPDLAVAIFPCAVSVALFNFLFHLKAGTGKGWEE
ncbi:MAG: hypothetical protein AB1497_03615 [Bacillota bacterium]